MENELGVVDWQRCQRIKTPYRSIENYLQSNLKRRYDQHGIIGDRQLDAKVAIAAKLCQTPSNTSSTSR